MFHRLLSLRSSRRLRAGLAVTELAIGLPMVLIVSMGTIEACTMIRLRQKLKVIAYEGARVGVLPEAQLTNVTYQCDLLATDQSITALVVSTTPGDPSTLNSGDWFEVTATAAFNQNAATGAWMSSAYTLTETVSMQKP